MTSHSSSPVTTDAALNCESCLGAVSQQWSPTRDPPNSIFFNVTCWEVFPHSDLFPWIPRYSYSIYKSYFCLVLLTSRNKIATVKPPSRRYAAKMPCSKTQQRGHGWISTQTVLIKDRGQIRWAIYENVEEQSITENTTSELGFT